MRCLYLLAHGAFVFVLAGQIVPVGDATIFASRLDADAAALAVGLCIDQYGDVTAV